MEFYKFDIRKLSEIEYKYYYSLMSEEKKRRVDHFHYEDDKKRTIVGEMLSRRAIAAFCNVPEDSIVFEVAEHGKPYVKNLNIEFNISHSADLVVCVIDTRPVGVDIEKIRSIDLNTAKHIFTQKEIAYIVGKESIERDYNTCVDETVLKRFFELWTKKESYGKCVGEGLFTTSKQDVKYTCYEINGYCCYVASL